MSAVHDTVRNLIIAHPNLFPSKGEALHHIFCVVGSGFAWDKETGDVVQLYPELDNPYVQVSFTSHMNHFYGPEWVSFLDEETVASAFTRWETQKFTVEKTLQNIDKAVGSWEPFDTYNVYPQSEYCVLVSPAPENASQDWITAAEEVRQFVTQYGWKL